MSLRFWQSVFGSEPAYNPECDPNSDIYQDMRLDPPERTTISKSLEEILAEAERIELGGFGGTFETITHWKGGQYTAGRQIKHRPSCAEWRDFPTIQEAYAWIKEQPNEP